jgi:hypothetical protein
LHYAASRGSKMTLPIRILCLSAGPEPSLVQGRQAHSTLGIRIAPHPLHFAPHG